MPLSFHEFCTTYFPQAKPLPAWQMEIVDNLFGIPPINPFDLRFEEWRRELRRLIERHPPLN